MNPGMNSGLSAVSEFIKAHDGFTIIAHSAPDGDALGSSAALYGVLKNVGKNAQIVCESKVPANYSFLPFIENMNTVNEAKAFPYVIAVDCADKTRLGDCAALFDMAVKTVSIDHHKTNSFYADINFVDPDVAAAGEIVFRLSKTLGIEPDKDIAACLYTAIMTDTGNFAYNNTNPDTFIAASELLKTRIDIFYINQRVYRSVSYAKAKLLGLALSKMETLYKGTVGAAVISKADMDACGAGEEDSEGIIDHIRDVNGVEVAVFIREAGPNVCKVSLRSKNYVDVSSIAARFNGGGHFGAAGYTAYKTPAEAYKEITEYVFPALAR
jgi:phosphoesterase RecJ-like protein